MAKGVPIGLKNVVYAKLINDPDFGTGVATYETPVRIPGAITASINPNSSTETLFADDGPYETASTIGQIGLELNVADLPMEIQADLLGHTIVGGVLQRKSSDIPPFIAVGFMSLKSNGSYRYTWLNKGKFSLPEQANQTKADSINWNTPTISGSFLKRECDDEWERHIDQDFVDYVPSQGANWFNNPYGDSLDVTVPTLTTSVPVTGATAVAVGATVVLTFSEPMALSTLNTGNISLYNDTSGNGVAAGLSVNAARTIVTLTPTAALAAATKYRVVMSAGLKDAGGNSFVARSITFTTA
jgi:phi13 family phage major tail protein